MTKRQVWHSKSKATTADGHVQSRVTDKLETLGGPLGSSAALTAEAIHSIALEPSLHLNGHLGGSKQPRDEDRLGNVEAVVAEPQSLFSENAELWVEPTNANEYLRRSKRLCDEDRLADAEAVLLEAQSLFPENAEVWVQFAWIAHSKRDWDQAICRWAVVRDRVPGNGWGYVGAARALNEMGNDAAAEELVEQGITLLPDDRGVLATWADAAVRRRDWTEARRRWERACSLYPQEFWFGESHGMVLSSSGDWAAAAEHWCRLRKQWPDQADAYLQEARALTYLELADTAENVLRIGVERLPNDARLTLEWAEAAMRRRDWRQAERRFAQVRKRFPEQPQGYLRGAEALCLARKDSDAQALLNDAIRLSPETPEMLAQIVSVAITQKNWSFAFQCCLMMREKFPQSPSGWLCSIEVMRGASDFGSAERLLEDIPKRFSDNISLLLAWARLPYTLGKKEEHIRRSQWLRSRFPDNVEVELSFIRALLSTERWSDAITALKGKPTAIEDHAEFSEAYGDALMGLRDWVALIEHCDLARRRWPDRFGPYLHLARAYNELGRLEEADATFEDGAAHFPDHEGLAVAFATNAQHRRDWTSAVKRWRSVRDRFPKRVEGYAQAAIALAALHQFDESENLAAQALRDFPEEADAIVASAEVAAAREDWPTAVRRWYEASQRYPDRPEFRGRWFIARLNLAESENESPGSPELPPAFRDQMYEIMMRFEGLGSGCEFGGVQRKFGAEPLGLLRWAAISPEGLCQALESEFEGVGLPANTELSVRRQSGVGEYWIDDRRLDLSMHTFVAEHEMTFERMHEKSCQRLQFLSRKLIDDLRNGEKIFLYNFSLRNLVDAEISQIFEQICRYGNNNLVCIRKADAAHSPGLVEELEPRLLVGYLDHFFTLDEGGRIHKVSEIWDTICYRAADMLGLTTAATAGPVSGLSGRRK